jgi:hypothetical protein
VLHRFRCWRVARRFPGYRPQPVTTASVMRWLNPYSSTDQGALLRLLGSLIYLTEDETRQIMIDRNGALLRRLNGSGIKPSEVVYVQVHDAGSSSPLMLNILKEFSALQRLGCKLLDSKDATGFARAFRGIEEGVVVYVDDFAGSGNQLCTVRDLLAQLIPPTFAEFVIMPAMCEEAYGKFVTRGIEPYTRFLHSRSERPLDDTSALLPIDVRANLRRLCANVVPPVGLGYESIASHIVFWRNAPNTIPAVLRGSRGQRPYPGLFPRTDDLAPPDLGASGGKGTKNHQRVFKVKEEAEKIAKSKNVSGDPQPRPRDSAD